jgi:hypothetical protein
MRSHSASQIILKKYLKYFEAVIKRLTELFRYARQNKIYRLRNCRICFTVTRGPKAGEMTLTGHFKSFDMYVL